MSETIFALASAQGRAGVAVVRISGPEATAALRALTGSEPPPPRRAVLRTFRDAAGEPIDHGLALVFPGPHSFTGEDVLELHAHGGAAVIEALTARLMALGLSPAEPGAFSRRAFENGKLDLAQAEAIADLVDAETDAQRRQALRQMDGALGEAAQRWHAGLVSILALLEAAIDFPDEDVPEDLAARAGPAIAALRETLAAARDDRSGARVRDGYSIALVGAPNAGKSSLLNALARRDAAMVSDIPGTTRDVIELRLELGGHIVWIADTAGLRETADALESEGVRRALARAEAADLRIGVLDARAAALDAGLASVLRTGDLLVRSKSDLAAPTPVQPPSGVETIAASSRQTEGLQSLEARLSEIVREALSATEAPVLTRARHRRAVDEAVQALFRAEAALARGAELAAEDVRLAARALGRITGRIDVEQVLGEIFASFCIGK